MQTDNKQTITVEVTVNAPVEKAWQYFSEPEHIKQWSFASDEWHTPTAENDLRTGGKFNSRMEAKDGSAGFDFSGVYDEVKEHELIAYTIGDGRKVTIRFTSEGEGTKLTETFEAETTHPAEMQQQGWQSILNNYKKHTEA